MITVFKILLTKRNIKCVEQRICVNSVPCNTSVLTTFYVERGSNKAKKSLFADGSIGVLPRSVPNGKCRNGRF